MLSLLAVLSLAAAAVAQHQCGQTPIAPDTGSPFKDAESLRLEKVVGGRPAVKGSLPWQISLRLNGGTFHTCGGTIICRNLIMTAAHCVYNNRNQPWTFQVDVGRYYKDSDTTEVTKHDVTRIECHPGWNSFLIQNDIAILQIDPPINYNSHAQPACFPSRDINVGELALLSGWGQTMGTGWDGTLKQAFIPVISNQECRSMINIVSDDMLCTGYPNGGHGVCFGDSGGPLVIKQNGYYSIIGVVSWTAGRCNHPRTLSGFARVRYFMASGWVQNTVNLLGGCR